MGIDTNATPLTVADNAAPPAVERKRSRSLRKAASKLTGASHFFSKPKPQQGASTAPTTPTDGDKHPEHIERINHDDDRPRDDDAAPVDETQPEEHAASTPTATAPRSESQPIAAAHETAATDEPTTETESPTEGDVATAGDGSLSPPDDPTAADEDARPNEDGPSLEDERAAGDDVAEIPSDWGSVAHSSTKPPSTPTESSAVPLWGTCDNDAEQSKKLRMATAAMPAPPRKHSECQTDDEGMPTALAVMTAATEAQLRGDVLVGRRPGEQLPQRRFEQGCCFFG